MIVFGTSSVSLHLSQTAPLRTEYLLKSLIIGAIPVILALIIGSAPKQLFSWLDTPLLVACRNPDNPSVLIGPPWTLSATRDITALGSVIVLTAVATLMTGLLLVSRLYRSAGIYALASLATLVSMTTAKNYFSRTRPAEVPPLDIASGFSFPSGHAMMSAMLYLTMLFVLEDYLSRPQKIYLGFALTLLTLAIGCSRVLLGVHYPSDVLAGWLSGLGLAICWRGVIHCKAKVGAMQEKN